LLGGRSDVPRLLAASDIYVSASYIEGMSISILEAMAAGLPVVGTCVGENSKLILPNIGILIPVGDPSALAKAIAKLVEAPELRSSFGREARSLVSEHHNVESWFEQIRNLYQEVVQRNA
jgi:glycosyltransferase involved in cell wall biosynthesis